jgi:peptidoglycan/LPS O-acetylase OafA/YrhL
VLLRSFLGQADLFGYGMIAAVVVTVLHERGVHRVPTGSKVSLLAAAVIVELVGFTLLRPLLSNLSGIAAALVLLAVVLPSSRHGGANSVAKVLEWLPFRFTGLISYSIYLWHLPIILWLISHHLMFGSNARSIPLNGLLVLALALPLSALTYYLIERPAMRMKKPTGKAARSGAEGRAAVSSADEGLSAGAKQVQDSEPSR